MLFLLLVHGTMYTDANELEIVRSGGLEPIIEGMAHAVTVLCDYTGTGGDAKSSRDYANSEELAAQCARALRNLSVNRK
jgi:hypothetical protein